MITDKILDFIFLPILQGFGEQGFVVFISFLLLASSTLIHKHLTPKEVKPLQRKLKLLQVDLKNNVGNGEIFHKLNQKISEINMNLMFHKIKPTLLVIVPFIFIFKWMGTLALGPIVILFGVEISWLFVYIILALTSGFFVRKALGA